MKVKSISICAILAALASIIGIIESFFPPLIPFVPGSKLGLANVVSLLALNFLSNKQLWAIVFLRIAIVSLLLTNINAFAYSLFGALFSLTIMIILKRFNPHYVSLIGISVASALAHNIGQLVLAAIQAQTFLVFNYLPWLSISGLLAGFLMGLLAHYLSQRLSFIGEGAYYEGD